jgi:hypothetical protein
VDPYDEPERRRPSALDGARGAVRDTAQRVREAFGGLQERARDWDGRHRSSSWVPGSETVVIDERRHPSLLVAPAVRTLLGLLVLATGLRLLPLVLFALVVAMWAQARHRTGLRGSGVIALGATLALVVLELFTGALVCALLLLGWLVEDATDWYADRLVVTDKRIYRRYGVLTRHSPSISLTAVAFIDAAVPPLGRLLHYGTLRLDSVAQRDAPLSRFDLIPDVVPISHEILRLRAQAMPRFPQQPY